MDRLEVRPRSTFSKSGYAVYNVTTHRWASPIRTHSQATATRLDMYRSMAAGRKIWLGTPEDFVKELNAFVTDSGGFMPLHKMALHCTCDRVVMGDQIDITFGDNGLVVAVTCQECR